LAQRDHIPDSNCDQLPDFLSHWIARRIRRVFPDGFHVWRAKAPTVSHFEAGHLRLFERSATCLQPQAHPRGR
jgi:hypothetical protein